MTITGTGGAPVGINRQKNSGWFERTVDGRDTNGCYVRDIRFQYDGDDGKSIISDIYFYVEN